MSPHKRAARMDRASSRTGKKKAHREKTGGEGLGRGVYRRIESGLPENLKNRKIRGAYVFKEYLDSFTGHLLRTNITSGLTHIVVLGSWKWG
jgi:hypothetical protein